LTRFNVAIDQALTESVIRFEQQVEHWGHIFLGFLEHELRTPLNVMTLRPRSCVCKHQRVCTVMQPQL